MFLQFHFDNQVIIYGLSFGCFYSMILLKIQMFSYTELAELLGWVDEEVPLFFYCQRWIFHIGIHVII